VLKLGWFMKTIKPILTVFLIILCQNGYTQGFINLNFEDANLSAYGAGPAEVPTADALPGWTVSGNYLGPNEIIYNDLSLGAPSVAIFSTSGYVPVLDGEYSVDLYGGVLPATGVSISQTGLVPANAESIRFIAVPPAPFAGGSLIVSLGGQNISFSVLSSGANYNLYGGNIPPVLDGQSEQLAISAPESGGNNYWELDDIQFSGSPVPEPNSFGLFALGGLFAASCHWRKSATKVSPTEHLSEL
jgi:hypothetical protein